MSDPIPPADAGDLGYLLTAYADGALHPEGAAWIEQQLAARPELRARLDDIRRVQAKLRSEIAPVGSEALDARRWEDLIERATIAAAKPRPKLRGLRPSMLSTMAVLLAAVLVVGVLLPSMSMVRYRSRLDGIEVANRGKSVRDGADTAGGSGSFGTHWSRGAAQAPPPAVSKPVPGYTNGSTDQLAINEAEFDADLPKGREEAIPDGVREGGAAKSLPDGYRYKNPDGQEVRGDILQDRRKAPAPAPATPAAPVANRQIEQPDNGRFGVRSGAGRPGRAYDDAALAMNEKKVQPAPKPEPSANKPYKEVLDESKLPDLDLPTKTTNDLQAPVAQPREPRVHGDLSDEVIARLEKEKTKSGAKEQLTAGKDGERPDSHRFGIMPVPGDVAKRLDDANKELEGAIRAPHIYYSQPVEAGAENRRLSPEELAKDLKVEARRSNLTLDQEGEGRSIAKKDSPTTVEDFWNEAEPLARNQWRATTPDQAASAPANAPAKPAAGKTQDRERTPTAAFQLDVRLEESSGTAAALALPFLTSSGMTLDQAVHAARERGVAVTIDAASRASAQAVVPSAAPDEAIGHWLVRAARASGLQLRGEGSGLVLASPRALDPTVGLGLDAAAFRAAFGTQPMVATAEDAQATFALDADTASFDRARARLRAGQPVDPSEIQVEHFVNAMPADYPAATGPEAFTLLAEAGPSPFASGELAPRTALVAVGVVAKPAAPDERKPLHLTLAIDCSGSMAQPGGLARLRLALDGFIDQLHADDRVAIVAFHDRGEVTLPATPGDQRDRLRVALAALVPAGSTNAAEGLSLAYQLAAEDTEPGCERSVLFVTDGATLAGPAADDALARITAYRRRGIGLTVVECGDHPGAGRALEKLADRGGGQHVALADDAGARAAFTAKLLPARLQSLAHDAKAQVTWNPERVSHARVIGFEERRLAHKDFRDDSVDAGELRRDTQATALFEIVLVDGGSGPIGTAAVRYFDTRRGEVRELACPLPGSLLRGQASPRLRLFACAAELGELLQQGWWSNVRALDYDRLVSELRGLDSPAAADLLGLAERAQTLSRSHP